MPQQYIADYELAQLRDHPRNPRRGDERAVAESIEANGFYGAIVAQAGTGFVLAGHTRRRALQAAGDRSAPVILLDVDDATAERILLADNRTAELATWDAGELAALLTDLQLGDGGLGGTGYTEADLDALAASLRPAPSAVKPGFDMDDKLATYNEGQLRQVVLVLNAEAYDAFVGDLDALLTITDADSYTQVIVTLAAAAARGAAETLEAAQ